MPDKKPSLKKTALLNKIDINREAQILNKKAEEFGGQQGPDPTRYGDWEKDGRCTDF